MNGLVRFLCTILPGGLFGRMILVLTVGMTLALLASTAIHFHVRGEALYTAEGLQTAQRIANVIRLLDPMSDEERRRMASVLKTPLQTMDFFATDPGHVPEGETGSQARFVQALLDRYLEGRWLVRVATRSGAMTDPPLRKELETSPAVPPAKEERMPAVTAVPTPAPATVQTPAVCNMPVSGYTPQPPGYGPGVHSGPAFGAMGPGGPGTLGGPGTPGFGMAGQGYAPGVGQGYGPGNQGYGPGGQGYGPGGQGFGPGSQGFGPGSQGFGPGSQGFGPGSQGYGLGGQGYGPGGQGYGLPLQPFGPGQGYPALPAPSVPVPAPVPEIKPSMVLPQGIAFIIQARFKDQTWVEFHHRLPEELFDWPRQLLLPLSILLVGLIFISLLAVRLATRPLTLLAEAAEGLGRDIHTQPLEEAGSTELRKAARAFNTMQARLVRYVQERTHLLAALSHDLKTPITRMRLRAEMLEDGQLKDKTLRDLADMEDMASSALAFIRGMEGTESEEMVDIHAMLETIQAEQEEMGREVAVFSEPLPPLPVKPQSLKRCLDNLVVNAVNYGERARLEAVLSGGRLRITVSDDGPGIPEADLARVFEPFVRLEGSRNRRSGGTGLGLSIARNIVRAHGGELTLRNGRERGLEAEVSLPVPAGRFT
ncbi:MAG: HAMP domain-containing protein [Magnetococcales bacterium]|nr:HAMP domain-containing protein [Magnetococcales bacterium]